MSKILITGIHGFVGSNLVSSMRGEHTIYGLDIVAPEKDGVVKTYSWKDLEDGTVPPVDAIIHLAGKAHDTRNKLDADIYFKVNTGLTQKIFDYFLQSDATKFIFFSTAKAAADSVDGVLTENVIPHPAGPYGESKIAAETYIKGQLGVSENAADFTGSKYLRKQVYILRPCMIHGPGNKGNLNLLYSVVSKGIPWPLGAFDNKRTFTSVGNLCYSVNRLLTKDVPSGIYNMGDDEPISTNELISIICEVLGRKPQIWHIPRSLVTFCAKVGGCLHLPLDTIRLGKLTEDYVSSNAKIKAALGVERMPEDSRTGLRKTTESFKKDRNNH